MDDKTPPPAPDYAALAQRYLELWQDQVAKLAKDPQDLSAMTAAWSKMAASMTPQATPVTPEASPYDYPAAPRAPASPPPYGDGGVDRSGGHGGADPGLKTRLDAIEQRLGAIESRLASLADGEPVKPGARGRSASRGKKS